MVLARVQGFPFTWALYGVLQGFLKASIGIGRWGLVQKWYTCGSNYLQLFGNALHYRDGEQCLVVQYELGGVAMLIESAD